ncbi:hypothetical protein [Aquisphaera insulae]|uniref:hypothetical protein n=1 Tax=Aquisphaera insulae TaxID=2712864 RepID=UPI0013ED8865|nr:hypothetical protein [Aquisphaera insulae]
MVVEDQSDRLEARLWDRARFNLMLLYGGRRGTSIGATSGTAAVGPSSFTVADPKF